jgi:hypothetical protein
MTLERSIRENLMRTEHFRLLSDAMRRIVTNPIITF